MENKVEAPQREGRGCWPFGRKAQEKPPVTPLTQEEYAAGQVAQAEKRRKAQEEGKTPDVLLTSDGIKKRDATWGFTNQAGRKITPKGEEFDPSSGKWK